ncbi:MAG TPA: hypothetical protein VEJ44_05550 [Acidimicrobiales bacterium]|nr:hypothetical protein [Acidimicrobiales bacterium]
MTVTLVDWFVRGLVSDTVMVVPLTAVTCPNAAPKLPKLRRALPLGGRKLPPPGKLPFVGGPPELPPAPAPAPAPNPPPPPPPPNPLEQLPEVGWETMTVVAVIGPPNARDEDDEDELDEPEVGVPTAVTHEPTVTADAGAVTR